MAEVPELVIEGWEWDDTNMWYLSQVRPDGVPRPTRSIVLQVWKGRARFRANLKNRSASYLMVGPDEADTIWCICITQTSRARVWRAFNGWPAQPSFVEWYWRKDERSSG